MLSSRKVGMRALLVDLNQSIREAVYAVQDVNNEAADLVIKPKGCEDIEVRLNELLEQTQALVELYTPTEVE